MLFCGLVGSIGNQPYKSLSCQYQVYHLRKCCQVDMQTKGKPLQGGVGEGLKNKWTEASRPSPLALRKSIYY